MRSPADAVTYCYLLRTVDGGEATYLGVTNNLQRRIAGIYIYIFNMCLPSHSATQRGAEWGCSAGASFPNDDDVHPRAWYTRGRRWEFVQTGREPPPLSALFRLHRGGVPLSFSGPAV